MLEMKKDAEILVVSAPLFWKDDTARKKLEQEFRISSISGFNEVSEMPEVKGIVLGDKPCFEKDMALFPNLKVISRPGTGYDGIDLAAAKSRGIVIARTSALTAEPVAEYALGLILSLSRNIGSCSRELVFLGKWNKVKGRMLSDLTVGIIGMGAVGRALARKLNILGTKKILFWNRTPRKEIEELAKCCKASIESFDQVLKLSDIVVLCLALNSQTQGIIGAEEISLMKAGSMLVNVGRGALIDEDTLAKAISEEKLGGIALDVFSEEPPFKKEFFRILREMSHKRNIILTPHIGAAAKGVAERIFLKTAENIVSVLEGHPEEAELVPLD